MIRFIKILTGVLGWVTLSAVILTTLFVLWGNKNGWEFDIVLSGSMEPTIKVGSLVVIKPVDIGKLQIGDVISFRAFGVNTPICHRIIEIHYLRGSKYFETKGDANEEADQYLTVASDVNGRTLFTIPYAGSLLSARNTGATKVSVLGRSLPLAVIVVFAIGLLFIALVLKETLDSINHPERERQKLLIKRRQEIMARRRKMFNTA
jgi:signal peptidase I